MANTIYEIYARHLDTPIDTVEAASEVEALEIFAKRRFGSKPWSMGQHEDTGRPFLHYHTYTYTARRSQPCHH